MQHSYWRMLEHIAAACRAQREAAEDILEVDVAAAARLSQPTVNRFEHAKAWPRKTDQLIAAYARLSGRHPAELWADALRLAAADLAATPDDPDARALAETEAAIRDALKGDAPAGEGRRRSDKQRRRKGGQGPAGGDAR